MARATLPRMDPLTPHFSSPCGPRPAARPKLLDQVREAIRTRHMSYRTEEAYAGWIRRFILFHGKRHPAELGPPQITQFVTALAVDRHVGASTQNQALAALLFLYREVFRRDPGWLGGIALWRTAAPAAACGAVSPPPDRPPSLLVALPPPCPSHSAPDRWAASSLPRRRLLR